MPLRLFRPGALLVRLLAGRKVRSGRSEAETPSPEKETVRKEKAYPEGHPGYVNIPKEIYGPQKTTLYAERIFSRFLFFFLLGGVVLTGWIIVITPPDGDPLAVTALSMISILFFAFLFLLLNFSTLGIRACFDDLTVRYGVFSYRVDWLDVTGMNLETELSGASSFPGIRMRSLHDGNWKLYYSAGLPRVTLSLKGPVREFSFTTRFPEKFFTVARDCVNRKRSRTSKDTLAIKPGRDRK